jgi:HlyD family secretion protein
MQGIKISDSDMEKAESLELRSEQLREILGQVPRWIVRNGTLAVMAVLIILVIVASLLRYPDIIQARIVLTTKTPPADVIANTSARIKYFQVKDKEIVRENQVLAVLESAADFNDVQELETKLGETFDLDSLIHADLKGEMKLGEMQDSYASLLKELQEYSGFLRLNYHQRKIHSVRTELKKFDLYLDKVKDQEKILYQDYILSEKQYSRDSSLFAEKIISSAQLEKSETVKLNKKNEWKKTQTALVTAQIEVSNLQQEILELELKQEDEGRQYSQRIQEAYERLKGQISLWDRDYILRSPFSGKVSLTKIWSENQYVGKGDIVLTILPVEQGEVFGRILLPAAGAGKIKEGHNVIIRIDIYPYMEFGVVNGKISNISSVPNNEQYAAEVTLDSSLLITSYGIQLNFQQNMPGIAEVITNQRSLLERIIDPFRSAYGKQQAVRKQ